MALPLQPDLQPRDPRRWYLPALLVLVLSLLITGLILPPLQAPPRLLTNRHQEHQWYTQLMQHIASATDSIDAIVYVAHLGSVDDAAHPIRQMIAALGEAEARGVSVRVVLDRSPDWGSKTISPKNDPAAAALQAEGIPVYGDEENRTTHCKAWVFDQRAVILGSHNWTRSAATRNREWSVLLQDEKIARQITREMDWLCTSNRLYPPQEPKR